MKNIKLMSRMKVMSVATICLVSLGSVVHTNVGWANSAKDKVKEWVDEWSQSLKKGIDQLGNDFKAIQEYLDNYHWKGIVQAEATSGPVTLKHLELNEHSRAVIVKPGEKIEAEVKCVIDPDKVALLRLQRIVIGIKGVAAQTTIANELGITSGTSREKFTLVAPDKPGIYEIRFRPVEAFSKSTALDAWKDDNGQEPDAKTTIGIIIVK